MVSLGDKLKRDPVDVADALKAASWLKRNLPPRVGMDQLLAGQGRRPAGLRARGHVDGGDVRARDRKSTGHPGASATDAEAGGARAVSYQYEPDPGYPPGAWIRFRREVRLVVGVVQYLRRNEHSFGGRFIYVTDSGDVHSESVLEAR